MKVIKVNMKAQTLGFELKEKLYRVEDLLKQEPDSTVLLAVHVLMNDIITLKDTHRVYKRKYGSVMSEVEENRITQLTRRFKKANRDSMRLFEYND
jgi:divalent metal cation (Fe/Co/Zn/Cd) transporter